MIKNLTLSLLFCPTLLFAASGGPDTYGYTWKDSNEPGGPVFNWIDITTTGVPVNGLADDNVIGPFVMQTNMPFYWYNAKNMWIGSNGYVIFNNTNIASPFPTIPLAGGPNDYIAALTADLNFFGAGNPAQCFVYDAPDTTIISYINVPFWQQLAPSYTGSNTFQIILNKSDSTITIQFLEQLGLSQNNDLLVGIESVSGDIGLQHSADTYPVANYAVRFYAPVVPLIDIIDGAVEWLTDPGSRGVTMAANGAPFNMSMQVLNTGNQPLSNVQTLGQVLNNGGQVQTTATQTIQGLNAGSDSLITYMPTFTPTSPGTYRFQGSISGILDELVSTNNMRTQELAVYDATSPTLAVDWAGSTDDGVGIGWAGGNGGVGMYVEAPYYPCWVPSTSIRIASNLTPVGYYMKVFAADGMNGAPGTLIDSVFVPPANAGPGDHLHDLSTPYLWTSGGLYVQWYMAGENVNIAEDPLAPFSLHSYEVLDNVWAEYRDREIADFHLGLRVEQLPVFDVGCSSYFGIVDGGDLTQPTVVRTWVRNFGNQPMNNFPVSYQFASEPVITETYSGPLLQPGDSSLYSFNTQFIPTNDASGLFCAWSAFPTDAVQQNDTICVMVNVITGISELEGTRLDIAPNPAKDQVMVRGLQPGTYTLQLVDLSGALVMQETIAAADQAVFSVKHLAPGTYLYRIIGAQTRSVGKVVVQR